MTDEELAQIVKETVDLKIKEYDLTVGERFNKTKEDLNDVESDREDGDEHIKNLISVTNKNINKNAELLQEKVTKLEYKLIGLNGDITKAQDNIVSIEDDVEGADKMINVLLENTKKEFDSQVDIFNEKFSGLELETKKLNDTVVETEGKLLGKMSQLCIDTDGMINVIQKETLKSVDDNTNLVNEINKTNISKMHEVAKVNVELIDKLFSESKVNIDKLFSDVSNRITNDFKSLELADKIYMQDELLRLNDYVNNKLSVLKGDKGDIGDSGLDGKDGDKGDTGNDGDSLEHKGDYTQGDKYSKLNLVVHNGTTFVAYKETSVMPPGDGWRAIATKGAKGNRGEKGLSGERGLKGDKGDTGEISIEDNIAIVEEIIK